ncbi:MAG: TauD/TfdA family dioxygenase [Novosphingobium sp.]|nr:TauD/TfdA family dioxygenase [Novosphingobium sp.]
MASVAQDYTVAPLADGLAFGATVLGLTMPHLQEDAVRAALHDLWIDRGVILFRDGESSQDMQLELSRVFGQLEPHMFPESRSEGIADLVKIKYYPDDGTCYDVNGEQRGGWLPWHSDLIYTHHINRGGILRPAQLPRALGKTGYICQIAAYDRLPRHLRDAIEDLHVVYEVCVNFALSRFAGAGNVRHLRFARSGAGIEKRRFSYPRVIHPMVYTQEGTGRKVLNVSPAFAAGIYEMGGPDGDDLLREVIEVCIDPTESYFHDWKQDDMVLWDNWRTLHSATGVPIDDTRVMERTTITGDYALGRPLGLEGPVAQFDV